MREEEVGFKSIRRLRGSLITAKAFPAAERGCGGGRRRRAADARGLRK